MKRFLFLFLLTCPLWACTSCDEVPFPELPPETQYGANSFGCLVNNELVFADSRLELWILSLERVVNASASYYRETDLLEIEAGCQFGQVFIFHIHHPYDKNDLLIDSLYYLPPRSDQWFEAKNTGNIRITRLDNPDLYYSGIVSGTFSFDLNETGKRPIHVTKGRFDLIMYVKP